MSTIDELKWRDFFQSLAERDLPDYASAGWTKTGFESYLRAFSKQIATSITNKTVRVLDAGCGLGIYSRILSQMGLDVCSIDYSEEVVRSAKRRSKSKAMDFGNGSVYCLPFRDNVFDLVICLGVFQHLARYQTAMRELGRVIKPGGSLIITTLNSISISAVRGRLRDRTLIRYSPYELRRDLTNQGFSASAHGIYVFPVSFEVLSENFYRLKFDRLLDQLPTSLIFSFSHSISIVGVKSPASARLN